MLPGSMEPNFPCVLFRARLRVLVFQTKCPRTGQGAKSVKTLSWGRREMKVGRARKGRGKGGVRGMGKMLTNNGYLISILEQS